MIDDYDRLIGLIYDGIMDDASWNPALARIADLVGAVGVGLGMQDMKTHEFRALGAFGIDPGLHQTYRRLAPDNRIWQEIGRRRQPLTDQMVMPKATFVRTELFADWFRPQDFYSVMAFPALFKERASAVVVAFRNKSLGDFERGDLAKLGRIAGHFGRALNICQDQESTAEQLAATNLVVDAAGDPILLVDRKVQLGHANAAAKAMLEAGGAMRLHRGRLELHDPQANAKLARMAAEARGGEIRLSAPGRGAGVILQLHPCANGFGDAHAGYMTVKLMDPNGKRERPTADRLRDRLGLSRRQSEVIAALAAGGTESEAARKLSLAEPTLHTHIRRVYDKLNLRSRADLPALLAHHGFDTSRPSE